MRWPFTSTTAANHSGGHTRIDQGEATAGAIRSEVARWLSRVPRATFFSQGTIKVWFWRCLWSWGSS
jgi:hypothetical protein